MTKKNIDYENNLAASLKKKLEAKKKAGFRTR